MFSLGLLLFYWTVWIFISCWCKSKALKGLKCLRHAIFDQIKIRVHEIQIVCLSPQFPMIKWFSPELCIIICIIITGCRGRTMDFIKVKWSDRAPMYAYINGSRKSWHAALYFAGSLVCEIRRDGFVDHGDASACLSRVLLFYLMPR